MSAYNPVGMRSRSPIPVPELTVQLERLSDLPSLNGTSSWTPIPTTTRAPTPTRIEHKTQVVTIPAAQVSNKSTMCKAITLNKTVSAVPQTAEAEYQTDDYLEQKYIIPVPISIYIPELLMMAEMVAGDRKREETDSDAMESKIISCSNGI